MPAMEESDFVKYQNDAFIKPNPSNQNFYSKLIKTLSFENDVYVVSHRPFCKGMFNAKKLASYKKTAEKINYFYTNIGYSKFYKLLNETKEIEKIINKIIQNINGDFIIITDTLRPNLLKAANNISKKYGCLSIGVLTDNVSNLSNVNNKYVSIINKRILKLNAYLSLTKGINEAYGIKKPTYVFEGLATKVNNDCDIKYNDFYFFAGSLYERYGVKTLIDAFLNSKIKSQLLIAGNGPLKKYIMEASEKDSRIRYLSQLPINELIKYESKAIANINPRPLNNKIDSESIPSKLIEYLSVQRPVISTKIPQFFDNFKEYIYWVNAKDLKEFTKELENFDDNLKEEYDQKAIKATNLLFSLYGIEVQAKKINHFIESLISQKSN